TLLLSLFSSFPLSPPPPLFTLFPYTSLSRSAVRRVAYMLNVPHAFTPEYPADETRSEPRKTPVILHVYDAYMSGANSFDFTVDRSEEHTSELQSLTNLVCRLLLEKKKKTQHT